jgi:phage terminase large subunit
MWTRMKDWLLKGAIDADNKLEIGLSGPGYHINRSNKLVLESKQEMQKRGEASPDDADALALTFAQAVGPVKKQQPQHGGYGGGWMG